MWARRLSRPQPLRRAHAVLVRYPGRCGKAPADRPHDTCRFGRINFRVCAAEAPRAFFPPPRPGSANASSRRSRAAGCGWWRATPPGARRAFVGRLAADQRFRDGSFRTRQAECLPKLLRDDERRSASPSGGHEDRRAAERGMERRPGQRGDAEKDLVRGVQRARKGEALAVAGLRDTCQRRLQRIVVRRARCTQVSVLELEAGGRAQHRLSRPVDEDDARMPVQREDGQTQFLHQFGAERGVAVQHARILPEVDRALQMSRHARQGRAFLGRVGRAAVSPQ